MFAKKPKLTTEISELISNHLNNKIGNYKISYLAHNEHLPFENSIHLYRVKNCQMRVVRDCEELYIEFSAPGVHPAERKPNTINQWFDISILAAYFEQTENFSWYYEYNNSSTDLAERFSQQFSTITNKTKPYWNKIVDLFSSTTLQKSLNDLIAFRKDWTEKSWKHVNWNRLQPKIEQKQEGKCFSLGHFPEFYNVATEVNASFLAVIPHVWSQIPGDDLRWAIVKGFLDKIIESDSEVILSNEVRSPVSIFARSIQYLSAEYQMNK